MRLTNVTSASSLARAKQLGKALRAAGALAAVCLFVIALAGTASAAPLKAGGAKLIAGSYRSIWAGPEVAASPALAFLHPRQRIEIGAADARRLGLADGAEMAVADARGTQLRARVAVRDGIAAGSAFMQRALAGDSAERLSGQTVEIVAIPDPPPPPPLHAEGASEREQADGDPGDSVDSIEEALA